MANLTLVELLQPQYITETISKIRVGRGALSAFLNFNIGNPKILDMTVDQAAFRIFSETRQASTFRLGGSPPAVITPNPVGEQRFYLAKMYEKMVFPAGLLGNISKIGGPNSQQDMGGVEYVTQQQAYIAKRFNWGVEALAAGFVRGQIYFQFQGDQLWPSLSVPSGQYITVSFQLPSTNINQLAFGTGTPIIQVPWNNPSAPIFNDILAIRAAMVQQTGFQLKCIMVNNITWSYILTNTSIRAVGGVVEAPFADWTMETAKDEHGNEMYGLMKAKLKAIPWIDFYINDDNISLGGDLDPIQPGANNTGTLVKVIPDDYALFCPAPDVSWERMVHGGEWVAENEGVSNWVWKQGLSAWKRFNAEPTSLNIVSLLKCVPVPYVNAWGWGHVTFTGAAA